MCRHSNLNNLRDIAPYYRLITPVIKFHKQLSAVAAVFLTVISFTVLTDTALLIPKSTEIRRNISILYRDSRQREQQHVGRSLAIISARNAFNDSSAADLTYIKSLFSNCARYSTDHQLIARVLVNFRDGHLLPSPKEPLVNLDSSPELEPSENVSDLVDQEAKEAAAASLESETMEAFKTIVNKSLGIADEQIEQFAGDYLDQVVGKATELLGDLSGKYLDKVAENFQEALTDPLLKEVTGHLRRFFSSPDPKLVSVDATVRVEIVSSISDAAYVLAERAKFEKDMFVRPQDLPAGEQIERDMLEQHLKPFEKRDWESEARTDFKDATDMRNMIQSNRFAPSGSAAGVESGLIADHTSQLIVDTDRILAEAKELPHTNESILVDSKARSRFNPLSETRPQVEERPPPIEDFPHIRP